MVTNVVTIGYREHTNRGFMSDRKHLQLKRNVWFFHKRIPEHARHITGGVEILSKSLGTSCIKTARIRRDVLLAELHQKIELSLAEDERSIYRWRLSTLTNNPDQDNARELALILDHDNPWATEQDIEAANTFLYGKQYPEYGYSLKDAAKPYKEEKAKVLKSVKDLGKVDIAIASFLKSLTAKGTSNSCS